MSPLTQPVPIKGPAAKPDYPAAQPVPLSSITRMAPSGAKSPAPDDGTNQLLKWGGWTFATGVFFALLTKFLLGGIGPQGPHTNSGWMALIVTMMCLPFGFLLLLLGSLKWLRNRRVHD